MTEGLYKEETAMWPEHLVARKFLAVCFTLWVIQTAAGVAYGQTRGHHRRHREHRAPMAQTQPAVAQPVQPAAQPSGCTGQNELDARSARATGAAAIEASDWETCASAYNISLSIANGACARPEARLNLAICLDASGHSAQAVEQLELLQRSGELPPGTDSGALQTRIDTVRRRVHQAQARPHAPAALVCEGVQRACSGRCVDIQTDRANCGGCGGACPAGNVCTAGSCRAVISAPPANSPSTGRRTASIALMSGGGALLAAGVGLFAVGTINDTKASEDAGRLATNGCQVMSMSPTCLQYPAGSTLPGELAEWQRPLGGVLTGVGAISLGVGIVLHLTGRPTPPIRPTASLRSVGLEISF